MKLVLDCLKCAAFVAVAPLGFVFVWNLFYYAVNPLLAHLILEWGVAQSSLHLFTIDTIDLVWNYYLRLWWGIFAFLFFIWTIQKKEERKIMRRVAIAAYLGPFLALAALSIAAAIVQERAQPDRQVVKRGQAADIDVVRAI